ncbi:hypothetical protein GBA52_006533 [Prunus armeniaca]|nr:hypothetical protein GBA52_006533 [Prunus armeniaca]
MWKSLTLLVTVGFDLNVILLLNRMSSWRDIPGLLGLFAALNLLMVLPLKGKTLMMISNFRILVNPVPPAEVQKASYTAQDGLVERYAGVARVVRRPLPTDDVASESADVDDDLKFPHPRCGRFLKNAIDVRIL